MEEKIIRLLGIEKYTEYKNNIKEKVKRELESEINRCRID